MTFSRLLRTGLPAAVLASVLGASCSSTHPTPLPTSTVATFQASTTTTLDAAGTAIANMLNGNYAYCLNLQRSSLGSSVTTTGCGTYDGPDSAYDVTLTINSNLQGSAPTSSQYEFMGYGSNYYVKDLNTWYLSSASAQTGYNPAVTLLLAFGLPASATATSTTLNGSTVTEYSGQVNLAQLATAVPAQFGDLLAQANQLGTAQVSIYVGPHGQVDQFNETTQQTVSDQPVTDTTQITFSHFGQEKPIVPPSPNSVLTQPIQAGSQQTSSG